MTLEEKVAQLESTWQNHGQNMAPNLFFVDERGQFYEAKAKEVFKNGLGQMSRPSDYRAGAAEMAEFTTLLEQVMPLQNVHQGAG